MTHTIIIDQTRCRKDYACVSVCPRRLIREGGDGFPETVEWMDESCIECGHCLGVCPHGALTLNGVTPRSAASPNGARP
jgi:NAD-dependent dihydropyrimidine dehydrogenase PreA subunit